MTEATLEHAQGLVKEAEAHDGFCSHCHQAIKIYRYGISKSMLALLRAMAEGTDSDTTRAVDVGKLKLRHNQWTQLTKLRLHGLVAKVKENGRQIPRHWLITHKGWQFLGNEPIPAKVVVYNNQVLGHEGGTQTVKRVDGDAGDFEKEAITEPESRTFAHIREREYGKIVKAQFISTAYSNHLKKGEVYELQISKLVVGQPITIKVAGLPPPVGVITYLDIAFFRRYWKVVE